MHNISAPGTPMLQVVAVSTKELKTRIQSVKNTQKITDAMKLVAAAKVRRAQDAVINGRPFAENLVKVRLADVGFLDSRRLAAESQDSSLASFHLQLEAALAPLRFKVHN